MNVPSAWVFVLGSLAAWRIWKLLAADDVLDYFRLRNRVAPEGSGRREFLECPYCAGFWVSLLGTAGYYLIEGFDLFGLLVTAFAMSSVVVWIEVFLDLTVAQKEIAESDAAGDKDDQQHQQHQ